MSPASARLLRCVRATASCSCRRPLAIGATLIFPRDGIDSVEIISQNVDREGLSVIQASPGLWRLTLRAWNEGLQAPLHPHVRLIEVHGDVADPTLVRRLRQAACGCKLGLNGYGPTETTVVASAYDLSGVGETDTVTPVGHPLPNRRFYILDAEGRPLPIGSAGELCIAGVGIARGYLGDPRRTAERFRPDSLAKSPGARLYRSGDLARFRADGNVVLHGRLDRQIKLRGYRIELDEVVGALKRLPDLIDAEALVFDKSLESERIVAFVVGKNGGTYIDDNAIRESLRTHLPAYMIPAEIVVIETLPLDARGKVDRARLPPPRSPRRPDASDAPPRTETERQIAGIWARLLGGQTLGVHEDFFGCGGTSLLAMSLLSQLSHTFDVRLPIPRFFASPTIAGVAEWIDVAHRARADAAIGTAATRDDRVEIEL
jgi:acyl-coenzyme A synthetase/AMP-(fatty) acid ligase